MSRDNNIEDDAIEIDLGSIGRRIGGFFGKKTGKEKEGQETGEKKDSEPKEPEKGAEKQISQPKEEVPPAAGKKEPERGEEPSQANVEKKEAEETKKTEKDAMPADSDEDYFEVDLGGLFGRKKAAPEKKISGQAAEAEPQKAEGTEQKEEKKPAPEKHETVKESKEDEEIEIDFGKLFGRKKKEAEPAHPKKHHTQEEPPHHEKNPQKQEKSDAAVEIDLGKIGASISGLFGGKKGREETKKEKKEEKEEEEYLQTIELDIDSIGKKIIKHRHMVVFLLLAAIVSFSLYIRLLSASSPLSPDYDTYLHYRYARDIVNNNMQLPTWDEKSYYPPGRGIAVPGGYPLMEAYLYKFLQLLYPDITLINSAMILTALFGGLATIPAFYIGRDASGELGGLFSAFLVGTIPAILTRSVGSYADTDAMVLFFSLLIAALYMKAVEAAKERFSFRVVAYSLSAALAAIIFVYTWGSTFEYIIQLLVPLPFLLLGIYVLSGKGGFSKRLYSGIIKTRYVFVATIILFTIPFFVYGMLSLDEKGQYKVRGLESGFLSVTGELVSTAQKYLSPLSVAGLKSETGGVGGTGRNVYISVAEMQPPVLGNYTNQFGIVIYLALAFFVLGSSLLLYKFVQERDYGSLTYSLSLVLILAGLAITRLSLMTPEMRGFLTKFFIVFGSLFFIAGMMRKAAALGRIAHAFFENELQERALLIVLVWGGGLFFISTLGIRFLMLLGPPLSIAAGVLFDRTIKASGMLYPKISPFLLGGAFVLLFALFVPSAYGIGSSALGSMDPQWHDMLVWIKMNSAPDATVTTWWDPGHWVTAIADRRSGADGAHYPAGPRPISTRIRDFGWSFTTTNESESMDTLKPYLGNASEMYYISSNDLIGKFVWLSYFSTGEKQQYMILGESGSYQQNGATLHMYPVAQNVVIVVRESGDELEPWLYVNNNKLRIKEITYFDQNGQMQKQSSKEGEDAMVWMQGDKKVIVYMPGSIKDNILTRTYFFGGEGLERFKLEFANQAIKLYSVKF